MTRIAPYALDVENQARTVEVAFNEPEAVQGLLPGYSADAEILLERRPDVLGIPTEAIAEGGRVLVVATDGRLATREVETGLSNWDRIDIIRGLSRGDRVVLTPGGGGLPRGHRLGQRRRGMIRLEGVGRGFTGTSSTGSPVRNHPGGRAHGGDRPSPPARGARRQIRALFLGEAVALGGLAGLAFGAGGAWFLGWILPAVHVRVSWGYAAGALLLAGGTGLLSGLLPARRAARLDPVNALRTE